MVDACAHYHCVLLSSKNSVSENFDRCNPNFSWTHSISSLFRRSLFWMLEMVRYLGGPLVKRLLSRSLSLSYFPSQYIIFICSSNEIASFLTYLTPSPLVAVRLVRTFANLVDEHVAAIGRAHSPTLESLDVSECSHVSWEAVSSLLLGCPKLHSLDIGYCSQLASENPKDVASAIRAASQRLRFLNMTSLLSVSLAASASLVDALTALPNLQDVRLCGSTKLTDEMVELVPTLYDSADSI